MVLWLRLPSGHWPAPRGTKIPHATCSQQKKSSTICSVLETLLRLWISAENFHLMKIHRKGPGAISGPVVVDHRLSFSGCTGSSAIAAQALHSSAQASHCGGLPLWSKAPVLTDSVVVAQGCSPMAQVVIFPDQGLAGVLCTARWTLNH